LAALAATLLLAVVPASAPGAPKAAATSTTSIARANPAGAMAAEGLTIFTIDGTAFPGRINAFVSTTARLTLVSPEGITAPSTPGGECVQDSPTQVSCLGGFVDVIAGDLKGGADTFTAATLLPVQIGASLVGADKPLAGGSGRDRLVGGAATDLIEGGGGPDAIVGTGSADLLRGGAGRDQLSGGEAADALFGGGGRDLLNGGPGRDLCSGGGGRDRASDCTGYKKVP
jgi:hypothetical protein